jgi:hypothetical protein
MRIDGVYYSLSSLPSGFTVLTAEYSPRFGISGTPGSSNGTVECTVGIGGVRDVYDAPYEVTNLSIANLLGPHTFVHTGHAVDNLIDQVVIDPMFDPSNGPSIFGTYVIRSRVLSVSFDGGRDIKFDDGFGDYSAPHWRWDDI